MAAAAAERQEAVVVAAAAAERAALRPAALSLELRRTGLVDLSGSPRSGAGP